MVVVSTLGSKAVVLVTVALAWVMVVVSVWPPCIGREITIEETAPSVVYV